MNPLTSANSISLGRLLPQIVYYAHAVFAHWLAYGRRLNFVIPTGNLGNALAQSGNRKEARESYKKAEAIDPTDPRVKAVIQELDAIEKAGPAAPKPAPTP